jgi:hypothetical protein
MIGIALTLALAASEAAAAPRRYLPTVVPEATEAADEVWGRPVDIGGEVAFDASSQATNLSAELFSLNFPVRVYARVAISGANLTRASAVESVSDRPALLDLDTQTLSPQQLFSRFSHGGGVGAELPLLWWSPSQPDGVEESSDAARHWGVFAATRTTWADADPRPDAHDLALRGELLHTTASGLAGVYASVRLGLMGATPDLAEVLFVDPDRRWLPYSVGSGGFATAQGFRTGLRIFGSKGTIGGCPWPMLEVAYAP